MRPRTRRRRPVAEALEARVPLAGDVTLSLIDGNLQVVGDGRPNAVVVEQTAAATFVVRGSAGERLRAPGGGWTAGPVTVRGVTGGVLVSLGAGDDSVAVAGRSRDLPFAGFLTILAGSGADRVSVERVRTGGLDFPQRPAEPPELRRQSGAIGRVAYQNALTAGSLTIDTGAGDRDVDADLVQLDGVQVLGSTVLQTGRGDDRVALDGLEARQVLVRTDAGADSVEVAVRAQVSAYALDLVMAEADDRVTLGPARLRLTARMTSTFDGGPGRNVLRGLANLDPRSIGTLTDPRRTGFVTVG